MKRVKEILRSIMRISLRLLKRILMVVGLTFIISLVLSKYVLNAKLTTILEFVGVILMAIGAASVLGGRNMTMDRRYQWTRAHANISDISKTEIELWTESYQFCIFMGLSGLILLLIAALLHYI